MLLYLYYIYVEVHLNDLRRNHVDAETNEDEFDLELFKPVQNGENGDEADMHKVLRRHLYGIQLHYIRLYINHIYSKLT